MTGSAPFCASRPVTFLEQFDFFCSGFMPPTSPLPFSGSEFASLMMTFAVFGAGFLMRPIGAIVLGAYIDKVGRRKADRHPVDRGHRHLPDRADPLIRPLACGRRCWC